MPPEWAFTVHEALQKVTEIVLHARAAPCPLENDLLLLLEGDGEGGGGGGVYGPTIPPSPYHRVNSGGSSSGGGGSRRYRVRRSMTDWVWGRNGAVVKPYWRLTSHTTPNH